MIQSMTGFASKTGILLKLDQQKKSPISLSLKSLNSKFFEFNCKLPPALGHLETVILKKVKQKLKRGHIYFTCFINNQDIFVGTIEPSISTVKNYIIALETIKKECNIKHEIGLEHIIRLPNIFASQETVSDEAIEQQFMTFVDELIDKVLETRAVEGQDIMKDLAIRTTNMQTFITQIEDQSTLFVEQTKQKLQALLHEITPEDTTNALANDAHKGTLFALLDKIDIHEEISRYKSHLDNLMKQIHSDTVEKGKLFDFILQELARETNTISAKCSDATIGALAINAKVEIEKMREQVQNIV